MERTLQELDSLADAYLFHLAEHDPVLCVRMGLPVESIPVASIEEAEKRAGFAASVLERMDALPPSASDDDTAGFLRALAEQEIEAARFYWLTPAATPYRLMDLSVYGDAVFAALAFEGPGDVDRYLELVRGLAGSVAGVAAKVAGQAARGIRVPAPALPGAIGTVERLRASASRYVEVAEERLGRLDRLTRARLRDDVARLRDGELAIAFDRLLAVLNDPDYQRSAPEGVAWTLHDDGEEAYRSFVRVHTTPERLHELGREQCDELAERMREARARLGFTGTESEFHDRLKAEPGVHAASPEEVESRYLAYLERLRPLLPSWFSALPEAPYGVKRLDAALEATLTFGYYQLPTPGSPAGLYRYSASDLDSRSMLGAASLIYHELAPGHHFHLARQQENTSLPQLRRRLAPFTAFNEGWAEYAAGLGWEMGLYDDPWDAYGRLTQERFTAQRLVVDTGLNLGTMTLDEARAFMRLHTTESETQIATDTLRYCTDLPGQALTYRAGFLELTRLRREAAGVDVRAFHEAVLGGGCLPFPALRRRIARVIP
ncbi:DUF885 domain-containing protein [Nonomuraea sp. NPDC050536]|uniref:DUF885 domain-containing protein n=1 Tax=Nonomuraea sp. NPDC050536 TaxID=3364366 RepID=UPI0037C596F0